MQNADKKKIKEKRKKRASVGRPRPGKNSTIRKTRRAIEVLDASIDPSVNNEYDVDVLATEALPSDFVATNLKQDSKIEHMLPLMLPERIATRNPENVNAYTEINRRFILWRNNPIIETAVDANRNEFRIVVFMAGLSKEDIALETTRNSLILRTFENGGQAMAVAIPFYVPVKTRTMETSFNNGVLEVRMKMESSEEYHRVRIR